MTRLIGARQDHKQMSLRVAGKHTIFNLLDLQKKINSSKFPYCLSQMAWNERMDEKKNRLTVRMHKYFTTINKAKSHLPHLFSSSPLSGDCFSHFETFCQCDLGPTQTGRNLMQ